MNRRQFLRAAALAGNSGAGWSALPNTFLQESRAAQKRNSDNDNLNKHGLDERE